VMDGGQLPHESPLSLHVEFQSSWDWPVVAPSSSRTPDFQDPEWPVKVQQTPA
jgi:hypothetical protein